MTKEQIMIDILYFLTRGNNNVVIDKDDNLFQEGYLDSMGVLEMVDLIEEKTGKEFEPDALVADNLSSLNKIEKLIEDYL